MTTSVQLSPIGNGFNFATTGWLPLAEGKLYTYLAGTTTPWATWTTIHGDVENNNPIILGVDGRPPSEIWLQDGIAYKFLLADSLDNPIQTYDDLTGIGSGSSSTAFPFVDWLDQAVANSDPAVTGTVDTTLAPYNSGAAQGESLVISSPGSLASSGIWVLGSVASPAAVPVTRRSDSAVGKYFDNLQRIPLNPANVVANDASVAYCYPASAGLDSIATGAIGTAYIEFYPATEGNNYAQVAGGVFGKATGFEAYVAGGSLNIASGAYSASLGGRESEASGDSATVSGFQCEASGDFSHASGEQAITRGIWGARTHSGRGFANIRGTAQFGDYILSGAMDGATTAQLTGDNGYPPIPSATNQVTLPDNSTYAFEGRVDAREAATGDSSHWKFEGTIKRGAGAGTTAVMSAITPTLIDQDAGLAASVLVVQADTVIGCIAVNFTGVAGKTIQAVCRVATVENVG